MNITEDRISNLEDNFEEDPKRPRDRQWKRKIKSHKRLLLKIQHASFLP